MFGRAGAKANPILQVVMPSYSLAQMSALLQHAVKRMIATNVFSQADYDRMTSTVEEINRPAQPPEPLPCHREA